jgi:hypothetical protein
MTLILSGTDSSVSAPAVQGGTGGTTTGLYYPATNQLALATNGTQALLVDSSQNVGIGVTPSAWDTLTALQIKNGSVYGYSTSDVSIGANNYYGTSNFRYITSSVAAGKYTISGNTHTWYTAASGTAGNAITFTQSLGLGKGTTLALEGASSNSGTGITFPATQSASTNVNTLDDYEEGTWTPQAGGDGGAFTATYAEQAGKYVKIGNRVWASFDIRVVSRTLSGSGAFLYGLPFSVANNGDLSGGVGSIGLTEAVGINFYMVGIYPQNNASYCYISTTTSNTSNLAGTAREFWGSSTRMTGAVCYNTTS